MSGKEDKVEMTEQENVETQVEETPENEISLSEEELKALCREHV